MAKKHNVFNEELKIIETTTVESRQVVTLFEDITQEDFLQEVLDGSVTMPDFETPDDSSIDTSIYRTNEEGGVDLIGEIEIINYEIEFDRSAWFIEASEGDSDNDEESSSEQEEL